MRGQKILTGNTFAANNYENRPQVGYDLSGERGAWRVELSPKVAANEDYFLNVMQVMDLDVGERLEVRRLQSEKLNVIEIFDRVVAFSKDADTIKEPLAFTIEGDGLRKILISDLGEGTWQVKKDGKVLRAALAVDGSDGILYFEGSGGEYQLLR